jgi:hypothetical protein
MAAGIGANRFAAGASGLASPALRLARRLGRLRSQLCALYLYDHLWRMQQSIVN